jgi:pimeloyl-ACP methyl ester carboxylesterase
VNEATTQTRTLVLRNASVNIVVDGDARAPMLVCVHGIPGSVRDFKALVPLAVALGVQVLRVDMPGFGASDMRADLNDARDRGRFLLDVVNACVGPEHPIAVLGHSFGGATALQAAALGGARVHALLLINSVGLRAHKGITLPLPMLRAISKSMRTPVGPLPAIAVRRLYKMLGIRSDIELTPARLSMHMSWVGHIDFRAQQQAANMVRCPTLLLSAKDDRLVETSIATHMVPFLKHASVAQHVFDSGGHFLQKHQAALIAQWAANQLLKPQASS